jgi:DnaK suppressor protein
MARNRLTQKQLTELHEILKSDKQRLQEVVDDDVRQSREGRDHLVGDDIDHSTEDGEAALNARFRSRDRKLLKKVQHALDRIADGEYDLCEVSGEPIGYERLKYRPVTTVCIEVKEQQERAESERIE